MKNFTILSSHKTVPLALKALLDAPDVRVDGFILPGHVSTIIGLAPYEFVAKEYRKPAVVTGFEAGEIIEGILMIVRQIARGEAKVENAYPTVVRPEGNPRAVEISERYIRTLRRLLARDRSPAGHRPETCGRSTGNSTQKRDSIPESTGIAEPELCSCGDILRGVKVPTECPLFGTGCTPESPVGPCMVSTEGSCSAYYKYGHR